MPDALDSSGDHRKAEPYHRSTRMTLIGIEKSGDREIGKTKTSPPGAAVPHEPSHHGYLCSATHLGPPPAHTDQQKAPVVEELRFFVFEGVTDELQYPAEEEQAGG